MYVLHLHAGKAAGVSDISMLPQFSQRFLKRLITMLEENFGDNLFLVGEVWKSEVSHLNKWLETMVCQVKHEQKSAESMDCFDLAVIIPRITSSRSSMLPC